jgi:hypothetical protein
MVRIVRGLAVVVEHLQHRPPQASLNIDLSGAKLSWHYLAYTDGDAIAAMLNQLDQLLALLPGHPNTPPIYTDPQSAAIPNTAALATAIARDNPPHVKLHALQALRERVNYVAAQDNTKGPTAQIHHLLDNGDTEADIREHLELEA